MARNPRRRRVPTILQLEALECGAAALGMVLAAHGRWVSLVELRRLCGVSRDGSRAANMIMAAGEFGLQGEGFKLSAHELRSVPKPAIVFVNGNHFVVLEGFRRGLVHVNDPAGGRIAYTAGEFDEIFSGVVLTFERTRAFVRSGHAPRILRPLAARISGASATFMLLVSSGIALVLPGLVIPSFTRAFIDQYVIEKQTEFVPWLVAAMIGVAALQVGLTRIQQWSHLAIRNRLAVGVAADLMWRLLRMPVAFFGQRSPASIGARADIAERLADQASGPLAGLIVAAVSAVFLAGLMWLYSTILAGLVIGLAVLTGIVTIASQRRVTEVERKTSLDALKLGSRTMQGLLLLETLKAGGGEAQFIESWTGQQALVATGQQRLGRIVGTATAVTETLAAGGSLIVLSAGGLLVMRGQLTLGLMLAFLMLQAAFFRPVRSLLGGAMALARARTTLDQFEDIDAPMLAREFTMDNTADTRRASALGRVRKLEGRVVLRDVSFGYARLSAPLIEGLSLVVEPGSSVALVGASGSGKSTVGRLISGLHDPWSGGVLVDEIPLGEIPRSIVRNSMAVVDQDIAMFTGTIRDNISLWDASIPEERVVRAAKDAAIHDEIVRRPKGYDDRVEEDGRNFSGGQRQRIEIARALVTDPTILVLDEASSALDPATEKIISDNIRRRGCTTLIIAHRLSTVRDCDEIIVLERGAIVQRGTHEALIAADGPYRRLLETSDSRVS